MPRTLGAIFGANLKRARRAAGWTKAELAAKAGVSASSIGHWESGRGASLRSVDATASALGIKPAAMLVR